MPQSFASLHVHIIFSTKNREPIITPDREIRLHEYLAASCARKEHACSPQALCPIMYICSFH